jgi:hypothetical protein
MNRELTQANTTGYTDADLEALNTVAADLMADGYEISAAQDTVQDCWVRSDTVETLRRRVSAYRRAVYRMKDR